MLTSSSLKMASSLLWSSFTTTAFVFPGARMILCALMQIELTLITRSNNQGKIIRVGNSCSVSWVSSSRKKLSWSMFQSVDPRTEPYSTPIFEFLPYPELFSHWIDLWFLQFFYNPTMIGQVDDVSYVYGYQDASSAVMVLYCAC